MATDFQAFDMSPVRATAGVGLKPDHYKDVLSAAGDQLSDIGFFEIHAENYMGDGGAPHYYLSRIRERFPLSVHGVGLSLGAAAEPDSAHLARLTRLVARYGPGLVSEHVAWSKADNLFLNDLLPVPYTEEALAHMARNVGIVQDALGRSILLENPSVYVALEGEMSEPEFLAELVARTGCGLLLDVNNVFVSRRNLGADPDAYFDAFPFDAVGEIHLAGHELERHGDFELRVDDHGSPVIDEVWRLYAGVISRLGPAPTLIEWDANLPDFATLCGEARRATAILDEVRAKSTRAAADA